jgi:soluble lytic murein transglycosylase-like protein
MIDLVRRSWVAALLLALIALAGAHQPVAADGVARWRPLIAQAAERHGVDASLIAAIMAVESGGDPAAVGAAGEIGLLQILPSTGRLLGVSPGQLRDPATNLDTGARYLAIELRACGGDVACGLRGYNGGPRARTQPLPHTRQYVATVLRRRATAGLPGMPATGGARIVQAVEPPDVACSRQAAWAREE